MRTVKKSKISLCHRKFNHASQLIFSGLRLISKTLKGNVKNGHQKKRKKIKLSACLCMLCWEEQASHESQDCNQL